MRAPNTKWTDELVARANVLRDLGLTYRAIDARLGLRQGASEGKLRLRGDVRHRDSALERRAVPARVMADREARLAAADMRDLTAVFCGDPPVGYRALDGKTGQR